MEKKDYKRLLQIHGLNKPFLVGKKSNKHCVFIYNPETKRVNSVIFDKYDMVNVAKINKNNDKKIDLNYKKINDNQLKDKKFWVNNYLNGKMTMKKMSELKTRKIVKGKFK